MPQHTTATEYPYAGLWKQGRFPGLPWAGKPSDDSDGPQPDLDARELDEFLNRLETKDYKITAELDRVPPYNNRSH